MSIDIKNVILHQVAKNEQEELVVNFRTTKLDESNKTEAFVNHLNNSFTSKAKRGTAKFDDDSCFNEFLAGWTMGAFDFVTFSSKVAQLFTDYLVRYPFADEGTIAIAHYKTMTCDYLLVGLLPSEQAIQVTGSLNLCATDYVNLRGFDIAARIDLSHQNSISYVQGSVGRQIAYFLLDMLKATPSFNIKEQNTILVQAIDDFVRTSDLDSADRILYKKSAHNYTKSVDDVSIDELSCELHANSDGVTFGEYVVNQGYELIGEFPADDNTLKQLVKYSGAGGGLNITMDAVLLNERVFYDPETDTLTIKGTPPRLRDQLCREAKVK